MADEKKTKESKKMISKIQDQLNPDPSIIRMISIFKEQADDKMTRVYYMTKIISINS